MKRALITGITGQDGSYLAELLLSKGYEVHGLIRRASTFNTSRIDHLYVDPHQPTHGCSCTMAISPTAPLVTLLSTIDPDEVYNLAAQSHVRISFDEPVHTGGTTGCLSFYTGFVMILSFHRQKRMTGTGEQFQYILRDETTHLDFGIDLINGIKAENRELWAPAFQQRVVDRVREAVELKMAYAWDCLPQGILGLNSDLLRDYVSILADRRLERIGLPAQYGSANTFPWMSETIDLGKEKNFFETRVTEYQSAGALSGIDPHTRQTGAYHARTANCDDGMSIVRRTRRDRVPQSGTATAREQISYAS